MGPKPSQHPSGGPWSERPSRRGELLRSRRPVPDELSGGQRRRFAAVALGSALLLYAGWHVLSDDAPPGRSRTAQRRVGDSTRGARGLAPLDDELASGDPRVDAGTHAVGSRAAERTQPLAEPDGFTLSWVVPEPEPNEPNDAGLARALAATPVPARPVAPATPALPPEHPALDAVLGAPALPAQPAAEPTPDPVANDDPGPPVQRHLVQVIVTRWQQPGLCAVGSDAAAARNTMMRHFRRLYWDNGASLFVDPRLSNGIQPKLIEELEAAEATVREQLQLEPARPNVFAYADTRLLLAGSCANNDVVAYYDGSIHLVPSHADVAQSAVHEYTHHALMSTGLVGPAWAQEGIAMTVANETWWRQRGWLDRVAEKPFSLDSMENAVPYTLTSEQATLFYVQAAAMVACASHDEDDGLVGLVRSLRRSRSGAIDYTLPGLADPRFFRACASELLR